MKSRRKKEGGHRELVNAEFRRTSNSDIWEPTKHMMQPQHVKHLNRTIGWVKYRIRKQK